MRDTLKSKTGVFVFVALVVFLTRLPLLDAGYGTDPDAWRIANAATTIADSGRYMASRLPGYPLQELVYALIPYK